MSKLKVNSVILKDSLNKPKEAELSNAPANFKTVKSLDTQPPLILTSSSHRTAPPPVFLAPTGDTSSSASTPLSHQDPPNLATALAQVPTGQSSVVDFMIQQMTNYGLTSDGHLTLPPDVLAETRLNALVQLPPGP